MWLGHAAQSAAGRRRIVLHRGVSQREDTDEALLSIDDWQPPDLDVAHVLNNVVNTIVFKAIFDVLSHGVAHARLSVPAERDGARDDIAIGDHSDQTTFSPTGRKPTSSFAIRLAISSSVSFGVATWALRCTTSDAFIH